MISLVFMSLFMLSSGNYCPLSNCSAAPLCTPRRCCGDPKVPVLGGVDLIELNNCMLDYPGETSSPNCIPTEGKATFHVTYGGYDFWFLNKGNQDQFTKDPKLYLPGFGGFCAFSLTGFDSNGEGFWCACAYQEVYFYVYSHNKSSNIQIPAYINIYISLRLITFITLTGRVCFCKWDPIFFSLWTRQIGVLGAWSTSHIGRGTELGDST